MILNHYTNTINLIKLGYSQSRASIYIPYTKKGNKLLAVLIQVGYIARYRLIENKVKIYLRYQNNKPMFLNVESVGTSARPIFYSYKKLQKLATYDLGSIYILSTSVGLQTHYNAIRLQHGGSVLYKLFS